MVHGLTRRNAETPVMAAGRWSRRLAHLLSVVLIVVIGYQAAGLFWQLRVGDALPPGIAAQAGPVPTPAATVDAQEIAGWHLFGYRAAVNAAATDAPETDLDMRLAGIFHSLDPHSPPVALIALGDNSEQLFRVGDSLTAGVAIERIEREQVMLARNGQLEVLRLPREPMRSEVAADGATPGQSEPTSGQRIQAGAIAAGLRGPGGARRLTDIAVAIPHIKDGEFLGLRLRPGRKRQLLAQLGLRPGDVLTELNGTRLTDPGQSAELMQSLLSADRISAKVIRNGAELPFVFELGQ